MGLWFRVYGVICFYVYVLGLGLVFRVYGLWLRGFGFVGGPPQTNYKTIGTVP